MTTRDRVVQNLAMLKGVKEGSVDHRRIINTFNNSKLCTRYEMTMKDAWCATAVSYAFIVSKLAGAQGSGALFQCVECSCSKMIELAKKQGIWKEADSYVPKKGDVIMYDWQDSGAGDNKGTPDHTGIVMEVNGNNIKVIEGNKNDAVGIRELKVDGKYIRGYIAPHYDVLYYKKYTGKSHSIVDALKAVGVSNPSLLFRRRIAKANNIKAYMGTANQNLKMLELLKEGKLKKPN